jgi:hypothetical protein
MVVGSTPVHRHGAGKPEAARHHHTEEGFVVGDIMIGGRPVLELGQLAEHMTSSLPVVVARRAS